MANKNVEEKELTIKWLEQTDKIIRFNEIDTTFDISDAVANFDFSKAGVSSGSRVSVKIDKDQGENGTVVYMTKSKGGSSSAGSSSSEPSGNGTVKTVKAYGTKYSGSFLFTDSEEWYSCDKSLNIVDKIAEYKDKTVEISTRTTEKGKKIVTAIKVVGGSSSTTDTSSSSGKSQNEYAKSGGGDSRQTSIEVQSCINNANLFYAHVLAGQSMETLVKKQAEIDQMIQHRALKNLELIKTLKTQA